MCKAIGFILMVVSFFGTLFFRHYKGTMIHYPMLFYLFFIVLGFLGIWLIYISYTRKNEKINKQIFAYNENFKIRAEKIKLDFDKCEFKNGSFSQEVKDQNITAIQIFTPYYLPHIEPTVTENVIRSFLTYTITIAGKTCKFVSQPFDLDVTPYNFMCLITTLLCIWTGSTKANFFLTSLNNTSNVLKRPSRKRTMYY